ncbi:hypothetical protein [Paenisporosarcina sp. NPDC076898]|uniref:hypothetical protein n=1 Tax=unclassified Paenisporosarcina TaxID=2642018 RepID=UPI003CFD740D
MTTGNELLDKIIIVILIIVFLFFIKRYIPIVIIISWWSLIIYACIYGFYENMIKDDGYKKYSIFQSENEIQEPYSPGNETTILKTIQILIHLTIISIMWTPMM